MKKTSLTLAFDIDGTIFSSEEIILDCYQQSIGNFIQKSGKELTIPTREQIMEQVGKPVKIIFKNLMPVLAEIERDSISASVLELLCQSIERGGGLFYVGVADTIIALKNKGYRLVVASNGRLPYIETILKTARIDSYFEPIITLDNEIIVSKGDILVEYQKKYQIPTEEIIMIGDRQSDEHAAQKIGCRFIYCAYGHAPVGEISSYTAKIDAITDLQQLY